MAAQDVIEAFGPHHPFFRPLWRRIALVAFCGAWAAWELWNRDPMWSTIAAGMAAYAAWTFLLTYKAPPDAAAPVESAAPDKKE